MQIKPISSRVDKTISKFNLNRKWDKSKRIFEGNMRHPSLHTELLEPHWRGIYSFRIDRQFRALFFIADGEAEVFQITNHYKK